jgi:hypothetical protein
MTYRSYFSLNKQNKQNNLLDALGGQRRRLGGRDPFQTTKTDTPSNPFLLTWIQYNFLLNLNQLKGAFMLTKQFKYSTSRDNIDLLRATRQVL